MKIELKLFHFISIDNELKKHSVEKATNINLLKTAQKVKEVSILEMKKIIHKMYRKNIRFCKTDFDA